MHVTAVGDAQIRCDYPECGELVWRHKSVRAGKQHFCSADCRNAFRVRKESEAADALIHEINAWYGEGVMHAMNAPYTEPIKGFPSYCREQFLRGLRDGRALRGEHAT